MSFWKSVKSLQLKHLFQLFLLGLKHPLYSFSTIKATLQTFAICQKWFPNIHGGDNKPNAFRHSLWNILIAKKCSHFTKNKQSNLDWTKRITDLHEELNPNELISRIMDLKNNEIGRKWYTVYGEASVDEIVAFLIKKLDSAVKINSESIIEEIDNLVFLKD